MLSPVRRVWVCCGLLAVVSPAQGEDLEQIPALLEAVRGTDNGAAERAIQRLAALGPVAHPFLVGRLRSRVVGRTPKLLAKAFGRPVASADWLVPALTAIPESRPHEQRIAKAVIDRANKFFEVALQMPELVASVESTAADREPSDRAGIEALLTRLRDDPKRRVATLLSLSKRGGDALARGYLELWLRRAGPEFDSATLPALLHAARMLAAAEIELPLEFIRDLPPARRRIEIAQLAVRAGRADPMTDVGSLLDAAGDDPVAMAWARFGIAVRVDQWWTDEDEPRPPGDAGGDAAQRTRIESAIRAVRRVAARKKEREERKRLLDADPNTAMSILYTLQRMPELESETWAAVVEILNHATPIAVAEAAVGLLAKGGKLDRLPGVEDPNLATERALVYLRHGVDGRNVTRIAVRWFGAAQSSESASAAFHLKNRLPTIGRNLVAILAEETDPSPWLVGLDRLVHVGDELPAELIRAVDRALTNRITLPTARAALRVLAESPSGHGVIGSRLRRVSRWQSVCFESLRWSMNIDDGLQKAMLDALRQSDGAKLGPLAMACAGFGHPAKWKASKSPEAAARAWCGRLRLALDELWPSCGIERRRELLPAVFASVESAEGAEGARWVERLFAMVADDLPQRTRLWLWTHLLRLAPQRSDVVRHWRTLLGPETAADERAQAVWNLEAIGSEARPLVAEIAALLEDENAAVRARAAQTLGALGAAAERYRPKLVELASNDPDQRVRFRAARGLENLRRARRGGK